MRRLIFLLVLSLPFVALAQVPQPFNVVGKVGNVNAKIFLGYTLGSNKVLDSAMIVNGSFEFKGDLIYPSKAVLVVDYKNVGVDKIDEATADELTFYLDKGTVKLQSPDSVYKAQIIGSPINDQYQQLVAISLNASTRTNQLMRDELSTATDQPTTVERQNQMQAKLKVIQTTYHNAIKSFIVANPNSYLSLLSLGTLAGTSPDPNEILPLLDGLSKELRETETARSYRNALERLKSISVGAMAPDFEQNDTTGHPVRLSSFKGKYVLIDFWASWCGPCRQENPNVVNVYNKFKSKNFTIIGISLDKPEGGFSWMQAIRQDHLNWTQLSDLKFWNNAVAQLYFVQGIPKNFLIDPSGKIIAQDLRGDDLEAKLEEVLGKI